MAKKKTTRTRKPFTAKECATIIKKVQDYPTNIKYGLTQAANLIGRPLEAVHSKYYGSKKGAGLKDNPHVYSVSTGSKAGFSKNVKNLHKDKRTGVLGSQKLSPSLLVVQHYTNVNPKAKAALLAFLHTI